MAEPKRITRDDMEAAAERIAARDDITVEEVRERVRRGGTSGWPATCKGCGEPFTAHRADHDYCTTKCRVDNYRAANSSQADGGAS